MADEFTRRALTEKYPLNRTAFYNGEVQLPLTVAGGSPTLSTIIQAKYNAHFLCMSISPIVYDTVNQNVYGVGIALGANLRNITFQMADTSEVMSFGSPNGIGINGQTLPSMLNFGYTLPAYIYLQPLERLKINWQWTPPVNSTFIFSWVLTGIEYVV